MTVHRESDRDNLLQEATRALRQSPVPAGPPDDAIAEIEEALERGADRHRSLSLIQRSRAMKPLTKFAAVAASLLVISGTVAWILTAGGGSSVALANVASVLDNIHSATFTGTTTKEGEPPVTAKCMFLEPSRSRMESSRGMVIICGDSKMITLVPERNSAFVFDLDNAPEDGIVKNWLEDVREKIDQAMAGSENDVEKLGQRQIDGRDAVGFRLRVENQEMIVWADPVTALPIRVESSNGVMGPKFHHVMSDFSYNVDLDESLFSVEPPNDYNVQEVSMDASKPQERDFVELLRVCAAEQKDGVFPPTLNGSEVEKIVSRRIQEEISAKYGDWRANAELRKKVMQSEEFKEFMELGMKLGRGLGFLQDGLPPDAVWRYAGKDVMLDTPDRPIFWYRPADSDNYRVIYADLGVHEVAAEALKGFPEAVGPE